MSGPIFVLLYNSEFRPVSLQMKRRFEAPEDVVLQKDVENAMEGSCEQRDHFKENGYKKIFRIRKGQLKYLET